ncbi:hypothetical protein [Parafrankia sp. EUN1f]|uniref:hypothetical protein n=1 Tax=Parafrankia sp. EUN1f TaxID=102897 RepID=UPI0001C45247|nr:hypothetical protein [Parafrankia sp. EUN1f]EFC79172.1 hypothetical protein FrEUN1fDRAFT_7703 [Parafrankia sp. EUN1f]
MPWFRISDDAADHPKVVAAGNEAFGLWARLGAYAAKYLTNGFVPAAVALQRGPQELIDRLLAVRLLDPAEGGWTIHDYLDHNPSRAELLAALAVKKASAINPDLRGTVKRRDGDRCRYQGCGRVVSWGDRRTIRGAVLDLVDPAAAVNENNLVVACRGCQKRHVGRAAEEAGLALGPIPPPTGPGRPTQIRSRTDPDPVRNRSGADPDPIQKEAESTPDPIRNPGPYPFPSPLRGGDGNGGQPPTEREPVPEPRADLTVVPDDAAELRDQARQTIAATVRRCYGKNHVVGLNGAKRYLHPEPAESAAANAEPPAIPAAPAPVPAAPPAEPAAASRLHLVTTSRRARPRPQTNPPWRQLALRLFLQPAALEPSPPAPQAQPELRPAAVA